MLLAAFLVKIGPLGPARSEAATFEDVAPLHHAQGTSRSVVKHVRFSTTLHWEKVPYKGKKVIRFLFPYLEGVSNYVHA